MKSRMYWGVAILILLLVSAAVFVILHETAENRELNNQLAEVEKLADEINQRKISENNPIPKESISNPVEHQDIRVDDVSNETEHQENKVTIPTFSVGDEVDISKYIELPTDVELASYDKIQRTLLLRSLTTVLEEVGKEKDEVSAQRHQVISDMRSLLEDLLAKRVNSHDHSQAMKKLRTQQANLQQKSKYLLAVKAELRQQAGRIFP